MRLFLKELESTLKQHGINVASDLSEQQRIVNVLVSSPVVSSSSTSFTKGKHWPIGHTAIWPTFANKIIA